MKGIKKNAKHLRWTNTWLVIWLVGSSRGLFCYSKGTVKFSGIQSRPCVNRAVPPYQSIFKFVLNDWSKDYAWFNNKRPNTPTFTFILLVGKRINLQVNVDAMRCVMCFLFVNLNAQFPQQMVRNNVWHLPRPPVPRNRFLRWNRLLSICRVNRTHVRTGSQSNQRCCSFEVF